MNTEDELTPDLCAALRQEFESCQSRLRMMAETERRIAANSGTRYTRFLDEVARVLDDMLADKISEAQGRYRLLCRLKELGYDPETGFPDDIEKVPPARRGSLQDLSSHARRTLIIKTNLLDKMNQVRWMSEQSRMALFVTPAWELIRVKRPAGAPRDWVRRWMDARATLDDPETTTNPNEIGGRMVALKSSPIWQALGDGAGGYKDTLGNPWPPFAFCAGMSTRGVRRRDVYALGILRRGQRVEAAAGCD